jgi:CRISPR-associated protein Cmr6
MSKRPRRSRQFPGNRPRPPVNPARPAAARGEGDSPALAAQPEPAAHSETAPQPAAPPPLPPGLGAVPASPLFDSLTQQLAGQAPAPLPPGQKGQARRVPMEFRAQAAGRCRRQYINKPQDPPPGWRSDAQRWVDEWVGRVDATNPFEADASQASSFRVVAATIDWRLISNSGVDEGFIRPVIGAGGWPLIPGSSIKGVFRRACPPHRLQKWCGSSYGEDQLRPGVLRFHGAWPADATWKHGLLDLAHPQQNWQVGFARNQHNNSHSAVALASLFRPKLLIGISSTDPSLGEAEWQEIEVTLKRALDLGLGGRTCAGYGSSGRLSGELIFQCNLEGQGPAAKLLDGTPEFRPAMFRAAIRGMALRLFGGLTDESTAMKVVGRLFGSLSPDEGQNVGLLATAYTNSWDNIGTYGRGGWRQPVYATGGCLQWRLVGETGTQDGEALLHDLLVALHGLTMSLGGFGRSWRRPDHRIFLKSYGKTPIGCHWEWRNSHTLPEIVRVRSGADLMRLIRRSRSLAERWLRATSQPLGGTAPWREVIHPDRMLIWTRTAQDVDDAEAIHWFHESPDQVQPDPRDLRKTDLAGKMGQVGRIWNRLLPLSAPEAVPAAAPAQPFMNYSNGPYLESLVLFPEIRRSPAFIAMMDSGAAAEFSRLNWD